MSKNYPIVGTYYRGPAASIILESLPLYHPLILRAEPENPADENAILVLVKTSTLDAYAWQRIEPQLPDAGLERSDIEEREEWSLGYIPAKIAAFLRLEGHVTLFDDVEVQFTVNHNGKPHVIFDSFLDQTQD